MTAKRPIGRPRKRGPANVSGTITLTAQDWHALEAIGDGNRSAAVRLLLHHHRLRQAGLPVPGPVPEPDKGL